MAVGGLPARRARRAAPGRGRPARRDAAQGGGQQRLRHVRRDRVRVRGPRAPHRVHGHRAHLRQRGGGHLRSRARPGGPARRRLLRGARQPGRLPRPRHRRAELHGYEPAPARRRAGRARPRPGDRRDVHVRPGPHRVAPRAALARRVLLALHPRRGRAHHGYARAQRRPPVGRRRVRRGAGHAAAAGGRAAAVGGGRPGSEARGSLSPQAAGRKPEPNTCARAQPEPHAGRTRPRRRPRGATGPRWPRRPARRAARGSGRSAGSGPAGSAGCGSPSDNELGHIVALKAAHAPDAETEQRLEREAAALAAVRHPNCVRIFDLVPARSDPASPAWTAW